MPKAGIVPVLHGLNPFRHPVHFPPSGYVV